MFKLELFNIWLEKQKTPPYPGLIFDRQKHRWIRPDKKINASHKISSGLNNYINEINTKINEVGGFDSDYELESFADELRETYGEEASFQKLDYGITQWIEDADFQESVRQSILTETYTDENKEFIQALENAPRAEFPLYKGIQTEYTKEEFLEMFPENGIITLLPTSLTSDGQVAEFYALEGEEETPKSGTKGILEIKTGSTGLSLEVLGGSDYREVHEWVGMGQYKVDSVHINEEYIRVVLEQTDNKPMIKNLSKSKISEIYKKFHNKSEYLSKKRIFLLNRWLNK